MPSSAMAIHLTQQGLSRRLIRASEQVVAALKREEDKHLFKCACGHHTNIYGNFKTHLGKEHAALRGCADLSESGVYVSPVCDAVGSDWGILKGHMERYHRWTQRVDVDPASSGGRGRAVEWWYAERKCSGRKWEVQQRQGTGMKLVVARGRT
ncbi:hypothetical protein FA13DRAFT_1714476 [Coprinellus micaceus]|uniref:Uncharacterized protein n=1 Tax=Coprinellus micaceus TaxID=71717 RepID=A0A4Y7SRZ1_COPMI|nr:hypothetical protein FA13DRAFT_1714476 [Coprinellus micaceus]